MKGEKALIEANQTCYYSTLASVMTIGLISEYNTYKFPT